MKTYLVGGAVRDKLMGRVPKDKDFVVVGSSPEEMLALGYRQVGADFPVFLDKEGQEYALARRERKSGSGHKGFEVEFDPSVTLEEDLARRDLTINAMAEDLETGEIIDPFGGRVDLKEGVLDCVSVDAFQEDPLRVLRVARLNARLPEFRVTGRLINVMYGMTSRGDLAELTPERVFVEVDRALDENSPSVFFRNLLQAGSLRCVLPEVFALYGVPENSEYHPEGHSFEHVMLVLDEAAKLAPGDSTLGWAALCHDLGKAGTPKEDLPKHPGHEDRSAIYAREMLTRLRAPNRLIDEVCACARNHMRAKKWKQMRAGSVLWMLRDIGALISASRLKLFLNLCEADERGRARSVDEDKIRQMRWYLWTCAVSAARIGGKEVLFDFPGKEPGPWVGQVITERQVAAIKEVKRCLVE